LEKAPGAVVAGAAWRWATEAAYEPSHPPLLGAHLATSKAGDALNIVQLSLRWPETLYIPQPNDQLMAALDQSNHPKSATSMTLVETVAVASSNLLDVNLGRYCLFD